MRSTVVPLRSSVVPEGDRHSRPEAAVIGTHALRSSVAPEGDRHPV
ncbi:hypothetical protein KZO11_33980 [Streptomyces anulatus]|nr:hypothetical protein [Streptomyces anulatus]QYA98253.1 hypothetical protein KZO11_33980 [Streptomyces anulatus]